MKKLFIIFLGIVLFLPLYASDYNQAGKGKVSFARQRFEIGYDIGAGFANSLVGRNDIFTKEIVIDFNDINDSIGDDGANFETNFFGDFFLSVKNVRIADGKFNFDFFSGGDGSFKGNLPKDLFELIAEGNNDQDVFEGMISFWGISYAEAGFGVSAKFGRLRVGVSHAFFAPLIFIPKSGINYRLDTSDGIKLTTSGDISVYSPFVEYGQVKLGFDLSAAGSFSLFSFLDVGGSLTNIPIAPPKMTHRMRLTMAEKTLGADGQQLINGEGLDNLDTDIDFEDNYDSGSVRVFRPFRFDTYARYKPFGTEIVVLTPNIGFTVDINNKDEFFNAGLELSFNFVDLFKPYMSMGREEGLWKQRLGFALNFRAFELDLETSFQAPGFADSFRMKGFGMVFGIRFGW